MIDNDGFVTYTDVVNRINQQQVRPSAIKPASMAQTNMVNTQAEILGPFSIANNASLNLSSLITNTSNVNFRLGAVPYSIAFFQTSLSTSNVIGSGVTGTYIINGPLAMPQFTPHAYKDTTGATVIGGNDGNDLVFITELINKSGSTQTIYAIIDSRVFTPQGGGGQ